MTITLRATGTASGAADAVTAVTTTVGAGVQPQDLSVLAVVAKPYTTVIDTPAGWQKIAQATSGGTASGPSTGSIVTALFVRQGVAAGTVIPVTQSGANSMAAAVSTFGTDKTAWDVASWSTGAQSADAVNYAATATTSMAQAGGDVLYGSTGLNASGGTQGSAVFGGLGGVTQGTNVGLASVGSTVGDRSRLYIREVPLTAGTTGGAPTLSFSNTASSSGATIFLRLRDIQGSQASLTVSADITPVGSVNRPRTATVATTATVAATGLVTNPNPGAVAALTGFEVFSTAATSAAQAVLTGFEVFGGGVASGAQAALTGFEVYGQDTTLNAVLSGPTALEPATIFQLSLTGSSGSPSAGSIIQVSGPSASLSSSGMTATGRAPIVMPNVDDAPIVMQFQGTVSAGAATDTVLWSIELYPHTLWRRSGDALVPVLWWSENPTEPPIQGAVPLYPDSGVYPDTGKYLRS